MALRLKKYMLVFVEDQLFGKALNPIRKDPYSISYLQNLVTYVITTNFGFDFSSILSPEFTNVN
jgi:hypothetical protein